MPRMPLQPCDHCCSNTSSNVTSASENIKLKIMEDKLRNDFANKEHTHEQYLTEEQILEKHYTKEETDSAIQKAAIEGKVDLTGYATEEWVESKKYLTEHQDISGKQDNIEDLEDIREGAALGKTALQEIPAEYITEEELEAKQYLTEHQSLEGYAKESFVEQKVAELVDSAPETLNTLNELAVAINNHEDAYGALLETVGNKADKVHTHEEYLTEEQILEYHYTKEQVDAKIPSLDGYAKTEDIPTDYLKESDLEDYSKFSGSYNDLTDKPEIPSIEGLATENFVKEEINKIEITEAYDDSEIRGLIDEKAGKEHTHEQYASVEHDHEEYLTEHQSLAGYATETFVLAEIAKAQLEGDDVDLSGFATKDDLNTAKAELNAAIENIELKEGPQGPAGKDGADGKDFTYEDFTEEQLEALRGPQGIQGLQGEKGDKGDTGAAGADGKTAFELAQANGFDGDERAWLDSLKGADGQQGEQGPKGDPGKDGRDGLTTAIKIGDAIYVQEDGVINLPEKSELFIVDFNNPNYSEAKTAYEEGKLVVLINAAPDVNSYAMMNYVSDTYITFTKFLMSRSETYGAFNTYYLKNDNTWEIAKEVKLNKVEITADGNLQIGKQLYETPSVDGLASIEYVDNTFTTYEEIKANFMDSEEVAQKISTDIDYSIGLLRDELNSSIGDVSTVAYDAHSLADDAHNLATETSRYAGEIGEQLPGINQYISDVETQAQQASEYASQVSLDIQNLSNSVAADIQSINENKADRTELFSKDYNELYNTPEIPSIDGLATEQFVENKLAELIDAAPETLNTLGELATAISENGDLIETLNSAVADKADKAALEELNTTLGKKIEENTGLYNELNNKVDEIVIPTQISELENDSNFVDEDQVLELIAQNTNATVGIDFTANTTVGYIKEGTFISADMTIGQLLKQMLYCEHDWMPSTCGKPYFCDYCGHDHPTLVTDHQPETYGEDIDATCTYPGSSMGVRCHDCGEILVPSEEIPQLPHEPSDLYLEVEPSCGLEGEEVIRCEHCGEYLERHTIPALEHDWLPWSTVVEPTYESSGWAERFCGRCGISESVELPALAHNYIKSETESYEATCEAAGLLVEICENCQDRKETTIEALGHKYTSEVTLEPTCSEEGIRTYTCSNGCGESYTEAINKLAHKQDVREENRVEPDCTNDGSYEKVTYCTECNEVLNRETINLPALGHDTFSEVTIEPSCTEDGEELIYCNECGEELERHIIPAFGPHENGDWEVTLDPDCEEDGEEVIYCTKCGEEREIRSIPALGHDYGDWVITRQPEVDAPGEQTKTCKRCGNVITEEIPALEPEANYYYLGGFGCDSQQDVPSAWADLEEAGYSAFNPETRAAHYVEEIKRNDAREYTDLIGQHELQWTITAPLGLDEAMTEALEEDVIISESDTFYPAIVIPSNYQVIAWSTDAENTYSLTEQLNNIEISNNYTVYYIELATVAEAYGNKTPTFFITIAEK